MDSRSLDVTGFGHVNVRLGAQYLWSGWLGRSEVGVAAYFSFRSN